MFHKVVVNSHSERVFFFYLNEYIEKAADIYVLSKLHAFGTPDVIQVLRQFFKAFIVGYHGLLSL